MEYRKHRGLALSETGVGGYALAGAYGPVNRGEFVTLLRRAHDLGGPATAASAPLGRRR